MTHPSGARAVLLPNDADRELVEQRWRDPNRLGFGVQLGTVRFLGSSVAIFTWPGIPAPIPAAVLAAVVASRRRECPAPAVQTTG
ncbi:MAG: DUF4158 domain-containing protein [Candidatus Dormibacteraeota bacterium]|nr:DUF4158 domain-containing protein [Candidatus Dormibacteraeota bacterium]